MIVLNPAQTISFFRTSGLGRSVLILLGLGFLALIVVGTASVMVTARSREFTDLAIHTQQVRLANAEIIKLAADAETSQRAYLLTSQPGYLPQYAEAISTLPQRLANLKWLVRDNPTQMARIDALREAVEVRLGTLSRNLEFARIGRRAEAIANISSGVGHQQMLKVREISAEVDKSEARLLVQRAKAVDDAFITGQVVSWLSLLLIAVVAGASVWVIRRYIVELQRSREEIDRVNRGLERTVEDRTVDLRRANDEIQRFAYIVSHDLRAPLVNVMGYTSELQTVSKALDRQLETLRRDAPESIDAEAAAAIKDEIPEAIEFIRASTAKMDRLIAAILKLSREGKRVLTPEAVEMNEVVQAIADSLRHQLAAAGARITAGDLPALISDRLALEQIFGNLLDNAVKYLEPARPGLIEVRGREEGGWAVYEIEDNGRGVDPKDHDRVFELFRRAGRQDQPGEGLGLAFVKSAVRRLGGDIDLRSVAGQGSTFTLRFPMRLTLTTGDDE